MTDLKPIERIVAHFWKRYDRAIYDRARYLRVRLINRDRGLTLPFITNEAHFKAHPYRRGEKLPRY